jgi:spectinomycin phosphotransferase
VRDRPAGVAERDLSLALAEGWRIQAAGLRYAPVGAGSYHWAVRGDDGRRWFVNVDDLDRKAWLGPARGAALEGLRAAMDTALALRTDGALPFVAAPVAGAGGETVRPLGPRYAVSVFPFLTGAAGDPGQALPAAARAGLVDLLAALHRSTSVVASRARVSGIGLPRRGELEAALRELDRPWHGGPFAEPARQLLGAAAGQVRDALRSFDRLAGRVAAAGGDPVITHGEPHPGNLIRAGGRTMLIDWDTVGLAAPERDLWTLLGAPVGGAARGGAAGDGGSGDLLRRYTAATGRAVDPAALALYRLRWALDDLSIFISQFRSGHGRTAGAGNDWVSLKETLAGLTREPLPRRRAGHRD